MKESINLGYVKIHYEEPIVYFVFSDNVELGFPEIRELTASAEKLSNNRPYLSFSDARVNVNVTHEGRKFAADINEAPLHRGTAVLVKNTALKIAANFFMNFGQPKYPFRAFTDETEAIQWLLKINIEK